MGMGKSKPDVIHRTRLALTSLVALLIVGLVSTAVTWRMRLARRGHPTGRIAIRRTADQRRRAEPVVPLRSGLGKCRPGADSGVRAHAHFSRSPLQRSRALQAAAARAAADPRPGPTAFRLREAERRRP